MSIQDRVNSMKADALKGASKGLTANELATIGNDLSNLVQFVTFIEMPIGRSIVAGAALAVYAIEMHMPPSEHARLKRLCHSLIDGNDKRFIFTLDSHEWFGPFESDTFAHGFAKGKGLTSYQLDTKGPAHR